MRIAIFSTETLHHAYIAQQIHALYPVEQCFLETSSASFSFETAHPFEQKVDEYESQRWFNGDRPKLESLVDSCIVDSINSPAAHKAIKALNPDAVIIIGTGILSPETLSVCPELTLNLHGGDPEYYRGLDSHLWSIYHNDFDRVTTTIHYATESVDSGDIIQQENINLREFKHLHMLRAHNSEAAARLSISALDQFARFGRCLGRRQRGKGRYYSAMPKELKTVCLGKFQQYVDSK